MIAVSDIAEQQAAEALAQQRIQAAMQAAAGYPSSPW